MRRKAAIASLTSVGVLGSLWVYSQGRVAMRPSTSSSWQEVLHRFRSKQGSVTVASDCIHSFHTGHFPANSPTEDRHLEARLLPSGAYMFAMIDGHSGWQCAQQLEERLPRYVSAALTDRSKLKGLNPSRADQWSSVLTSAKARLGNESDFKTQQRQERSFERFYERLCMRGEKGSMDVEQSLKRAFSEVDESLSHEAESGNEEALKSVSSGAVGLVAVVHNGEVIVANSGDCRAVLGVRSSDGSYKAVDLSNDHDAENPAEIARLKAAFPGEKVIFRQRLFGMLQPLRAFGDVDYKWPPNVQEQLFGECRILLKNPPYLTAEPEVMRHRLTPSDAFLIVATDGLWSVMSSEEAVQQIGRHSDIVHKLAQPPANAEEINWEENAATHLVLRAVGHSREIVTRNINLPSSSKRGYFDDSTVTVVFFNTAGLPKSRL